LRLAREGINLALHYRTSPETAEEVARECREQGVETRLFQADLSQSDGGEELGKAVHEAGILIEILVNNAGMTEVSPFWSFRAEDWNRVQQVNLESARQLIQALLPPLIRNRWGRIVNISSVLSEWGGRGNAAYAVSKAGMNALSRALALEIGKRNVTVNAIAPGLVATEMGEAFDEETRAEILRRVPCGRAADPSEVAEAVVFLCRCGYVNGEILHIDGGLRHAF
jgi:NAD(P)-dependent dehydrogenase (short-subunit alcohol dehydrogenase family)